MIYTGRGWEVGMREKRLFMDWNRCGWKMGYDKYIV